MVQTATPLAARSETDSVETSQPGALLVVCDELTSAQEAALLELYPAQNVHRVRSPELAVMSTFGPSRILKKLGSRQDLVIVCHDGCTHLARHYTSKVWDRSTRRRRVFKLTPGELGNRRNNHLWRGIGSLRFMLRSSGAVRTQELPVTTLVISADNRIMPLAVHEPIC
jgi:hypothetical protein